MDSSCQEPDKTIDSPKSRRRDVLNEVSNFIR